LKVSKVSKSKQSLNFYQDSILLVRNLDHFKCFNQIHVLFLYCFQLDKMKLGRVTFSMVRILTACCYLYEYFVSPFILYCYFIIFCSLSDPVCTDWPSVSAAHSNKSCKIALFLICWSSCEICLCGNHY